MPSVSPSNLFSRIPSEFVCFATGKSRAMKAHVPQTTKRRRRPLPACGAKSLWELLLDGFEKPDDLHARFALRQTGLECCRFLVLMVTTFASRSSQRFRGPHSQRRPLTPPLLSW
jgi:hypothetical protein